MEPLPIDHIGLLVADLEKSRERWQTALGAAFSPISRYRPHNWSDRGDPRPHLHDARLSFYLGVNPSIELLEFVGTGTHAPDKGEGGHHLSFPPITDNALRRAELRDMGVGIDGEVFHDGRWIFQFAEAEALNNIYTEWVEEHPDHPDVKDDLSPVDRLPDGSKTLFDPETILALPDGRPPSHMVEIGVAVHDLGHATPRWHEIVGYRFHPQPDGSALSDPPVPRIRLNPVTANKAEGLRYAVIAVEDLSVTRARLHASEVPFSLEVTSRGESVAVIDPTFLNGFAIRFRALG